MFNGATALVLYKLAVAAVVTGHVTGAEVGCGSRWRSPGSRDRARRGLAQSAGAGRPARRRAATLARARRRRRSAASPYGARETVVAAWAGMRGVVTVATALALPTATDTATRFPARDEIVFVALVCVLATLVVQGLTLAPLVLALKVGSEVDPAREVAELRRRATAAALDAVRVPDPDDLVPDAVRRAVVLQYEGYLAAQDALSKVRRDAYAT